MNTHRQSLLRTVGPLLVACAALLSGGCFAGKPSAANIELRKQVQDLERQLDEQKKLADADRSTIAALSENRTVQTLADDRIRLLFTAASVRLTRLTLGDDTDPGRPGDEGFKVAFTPVDQYGDDFKAAGDITVELFDLAADDTRLGTWTIAAGDCPNYWIASPVLDSYVIPLPLP
jgi:hypothetical protein